MKILMIGGTGIISSEICSLSIERGHDVTIVNRGKRKSLINEKAHLIVADVRQESAEQIKMKDLNCFTVESAMKLIAGTARSMGITVKGDFPGK